MRVIAGTARGRRLKSPRGRDGRTRPTSDLVRGAIFSALNSMGADFSRVLDLYAGSGALGIEALSRGGEWCDFVERDRATCETIRDNLRLAGFEDCSQVLCLAAEKAAARLSGPYTLVLADPPYADVAGAVQLLTELAQGELTERGHSVVVLEHSVRDEPPAGLGPLALANTRRHGDTAVSIYR